MVKGIEEVRVLGIELDIEISDSIVKVVRIEGWKGKSGMKKLLGRGMGGIVGVRMGGCGGWEE